MGDSPVKRQLADYLIRNLSGGLLDLPNAPDATYSRGLTGSNEQLREFMNLPEGSEFYDRGFGSYTSGGNPELDYFLRSGNKYNGVMEVVSPSMKDISELSRYPAEKEHLMMPNRKFRIIENNPEGHYSRNVGYVPRIRVEEIPDY